MQKFLDSSIVFYNKQKDNPKYDEFVELIGSSEILIANNLVKLEVLQGINYKNQAQYDKFLKLFNERFEIKQINQSIYEMARALDRFLKSQGVTLKQGKTKDVAGVIDIINFCSAKYYECQLHHNDKDFDTLEEHYQEFKKSEVNL